MLLNTVVGKQFDAKAVHVIKTTPGVARTQPMLENGLKFKGKDAFVSGFAQRPLFEQDLADGRWYTPAEAASGAHVAVIAKNGS